MPFNDKDIVFKVTLKTSKHYGKSGLVYYDTPRSVGMFSFEKREGCSCYGGYKYMFVNKNSISPVKLTDEIIKKVKVMALKLGIGERIFLD